MAATPETGFLAIADLTGYTDYLASSEIEHAPTIAGDLLETIVGRLEPPFRLSKFEGDAAFLFVEDRRADSPLLLDAVEAAYIAFRRRLRSIDQATNCECNSCRLAPRLDLKLFTAAAVAALGLRPETLGLSAGQHVIEHLGAVDTFTLDLEARWQAERGERRLDISQADVAFDVEAILAAEPSMVWAHLTSPALRTRWEGPIQFEETSTGGRRGVGTTVQCVTGRLATLEEIVDWQPYDRVAWRLAVPGVGPVAATADLDFTDRGTRLRIRWAYQGGTPADERALEHVGWHTVSEAIGPEITRVVWAGSLGLTGLKERLEVAPAAALATS